MRFRSVWSLFLWLCQVTRRVEATPIVGGQVVSSIGEVPKYPYMVSLQEPIRERDGQVKYQHFCGGSLINSNWILTAAHCVWRKKIALIVAVIGHENINNVDASERHSIERVEYIYFQPTNYQNDIALLRLHKSYENVKHPSLDMFAKIPVKGMKANRNKPCKIIGYGATQHAGEVQTNLNEGEVKIISNRKCRAIMGRVWAPENGENTICALGNEQDTCQGDSGGPLICNYNGSDYIYGIVSHGLTCGIKGVPSIYTVTIPYAEWIKLVVNY